MTDGTQAVEEGDFMVNGRTREGAGAACAGWDNEFDIVCGRGRTAIVVEVAASFGVARPTIIDESCGARSVGGPYDDTTGDSRAGHHVGGGVGGGVGGEERPEVGKDRGVGVDV